MARQGRSPRPGKAAAPRPTRVRGLSRVGPSGRFAPDARPQPGLPSRHPLCNTRLPFAPLFCPLTRDYACQWYICSEALHKGNALVRINAYLMAKAVAKSPDDQVFAPCVLKRVRLGITRQIADHIA